MNEERVGSPHFKALETIVVNNWVPLFPFVPHAIILPGLGISWKKLKSIFPTQGTFGTCTQRKHTNQAFPHLLPPPYHIPSGLTTLPETNLLLITREFYLLCWKNWKAVIFIRPQLLLPSGKKYNYASSFGWMQTATASLFILVGSRPL